MRDVRFQLFDTKRECHYMSQRARCPILKISHLFNRSKYIRNFRRPYQAIETIVLGHYCHSFGHAFDSVLFFASIFCGLCHSVSPIDCIVIMCHWSHHFAGGPAALFAKRRAVAPYLHHLDHQGWAVGGLPGRAASGHRGEPGTMAPHQARRGHHPGPGTGERRTSPFPSNTEGKRSLIQALYFSWLMKWKTILIVRSNALKLLRVSVLWPSSECLSHHFLVWCYFFFT